MAADPPPATPPASRASPRSLAASQDIPDARPFLVGPTTGSESNLIRARLIPKACWRAEDLLFDFDSSFVRPDARDELRALRALRDKHKQVDGATTLHPPLSVFGHADPSGEDEYNKQLSGRRATSIYALLIRDIALWGALFSKPLGRDDWGTRSIQTMLRALGHDAGSSGKQDEPTRAALREFQGKHGLPPSGDGSLPTRRVLFRAYMDFLCGADFALDRERDFLARGLGPQNKGDVQGCGEFNALLVFSKTESAELARAENKERRNSENQPNRRVLVLLFRPRAQVDPKRWPCPSVTEGSAGCRKRFFSDAARRRSPGETRRTFDESKDTFACRFYDRLSSGSPCELVRGPQIEIAVFVGKGNERAEGSGLSIGDASGKEQRFVPAADAEEAGDGFCVFRFDPLELPTPTTLFFRTPADTRHIAGPFDPRLVRDALLRSDLAAADALLLARPLPGSLVPAVSLHAHPPEERRWIDVTDDGKQFS